MASLDIRIDNSAMLDAITEVKLLIGDGKAEFTPDIIEGIRLLTCSGAYSWELWGVAIFDIRDGLCRLLPGPTMTKLIDDLKAYRGDR